MVEAHHPKLSIRSQCALIGLPRASYYYHPVEVNSEDLELMNLLDRQYMKTPFYGSRKFVVWFKKVHGLTVNRKKVQRLMRKMGIQAIHPKPKRRSLGGEHQIYPYLLNDLKIESVNHVWASDITYIPMRKGFMYLVAIIDWYSRFVLSWELSNTMESQFCVEALQKAVCYGTPEIFNTDQGSQFTSKRFTSSLLEQGVQISMDSQGRCFDNIFVERLWRTLKYEEIYIRDYQDVPSLVTGLKSYFEFYNNERFHQALGYQTPSEVYKKGA